MEPFGHCVGVLALMWLISSRDQLCVPPLSRLRSPRKYISLHSHVQPSHLALADLMCSWWSSCFTQAGVDDLQIFLQPAYLGCTGLLCSVVQNHSRLDGIISECGQQLVLRCLISLWKRLSWGRGDPQHFSSICVCPWPLPVVQVWIQVLLLPPL